MSDFSNPETYLEPTPFINSTHPAILKKAGELTDNIDDAVSMAEALFYFIRDQISYTFRIHLDKNLYKASSVLEKKSGFCVQKSVLFCALARACGIPSGLFFYDIRDYTLPEQMTAVLKTNILYFHAVTALYLNHRWIQCDATLHQDLVKKKGLIPVLFSADGCLMHSVTADGSKHIKYIREHGLFSDIPFKQLFQALESGYPHLYQKHTKSSTDFNWEDEK